MTELFPEMDAAPEAQEVDASAPLAARLRPRTLDDFVGQEHIVGPGSPLRSLIEADRLSSVILWGPPGTGKTSLATIIAGATRAHYIELTAVSAGVADVRKAIEQGRQMMDAGRRTILFIDEIHRFNKSQQDALLKAVESGWVVLIGATTENPFFEVNAPLISRSLLFRLEPLTPDQVRTIVARAIGDAENGVAASGVDFEPAAVDRIVDLAGGDARYALNAVEVCVAAALGASRKAGGGATVSVADVDAALQRRILRYDKSGDMHYDVVSAFIKSMRGSDPDAAVFWLNQMLEGGEDPEFIARRMVIFASEDIGNADPMALVLAVAAFDALRVVGLPEAALNLAQGVTYLASAPKSNASMRALGAARQDLADVGPQTPPVHLRDASYQGARRLGHGRGYKYPHDFDDGWVEQDYLPARLPGQPYYRPSNRGAEAAIGERLRSRGAKKRGVRMADADRTGGAIAVLAEGGSEALDRAACAPVGGRADAAPHHRRRRLVSRRPAGSHRALGRAGSRRHGGMAGGPPVPWIEEFFGMSDGVDQLNAENARRSAGKGLDELRARAAAAHAALLAAITDMSDEEWASRAPYPTERRRTLGELLGSVTGAPKRAFGHAFAHLDDLRGLSCQPGDRPAERAGRHRGTRPTIRGDVLPRRRPAA